MVSLGILFLQTLFYVITFHYLYEMEYHHKIISMLLYQSPINLFFNHIFILLIFMEIYKVEFHKMYSVDFFFSESPIRNRKF